MPDSLLSVQLFSVREALAGDLRGTLARLAELGFTRVEPYNIMGLDDLAVGLAQAGLTAPTAHEGFIGRELEPVFERAAGLGVRTLIDPSVGRPRWQTAEGIRAIAEDFAAAADVAADFGLEIGYHNHDAEFETTIDDRTAFELFASVLPDTVGLEIDVYWAVIAGADPVSLLKSLRPQVMALHLKDGPGNREPASQLALGSGSLPIREIIAAAPAALRVLELDDSRDDRFQAIADSAAYLRREGLL